MWNLSGKKQSIDRGVKYSSYRSGGSTSASIGMGGRSAAVDDDMDDIAVVSNANPEQVKYGSGSITANGPRVVPGKSKFGDTFPLIPIHAIKYFMINGC